MITREPWQLRMADYIHPDSRVVVGHSTAEPATLLELFINQRAEYAGCAALIHASFSRILKPEHSDSLRLQGLGAIGTQRHLARAGVLDIIPMHLSDLPRLILDDEFAIDVVLLSLAPPDAQGRYSLGLVNDYIWAAAKRARVVIAEVNVQMPFTHGGPFLSSEDITVQVPTNRPLLEVAPALIGDVERKIAGHVVGFVEDKANVQFGVGSIPDAIAEALLGHRELGVHSGVVPSGIVDLIEAGAVTNAYKEIDKGISVTGAIWGTRKLYDFVNDNPAIHLRPLTYTHDFRTIGRLSRFVSMNSAIEVDLSGQANLEVAQGSYIGAVGGSVDFVRGARFSARGRSIIALPSTAARGSISRIVLNLGGPTTISRSDVDTVVTEYGSADLRGRTLEERALGLIAIAHPKFRDLLEYQLRIRIV